MTSLIFILYAVETYNNDVRSVDNWCINPEERVATHRLHFLHIWNKLKIDESIPWWIRPMQYLFKRALASIK